MDVPRRSEIGWILAMVVVAVTLGFFIGGGPSLLTREADEGLAVAVSASSTTETTAVDETTTTTAVPETTTTVPARPPGEISVRVYNGSSTAGQAVRVGDRLRAAGYEVLTPGPSPTDPLPAGSIIHFIEGFHLEAAALASLLGLPAGAAAPAPNPPLVAGVGPAELILIVGDDLVLSP